jgi:chaperonin GroES
MAEQEEIIGGLAQLAASSPPKTEAGQTLLRDVTLAEQQVQVDRGSENYNLAEGMNLGLQKEIAKEIKQGYDSDEDSRAGWLDMHTFWMLLYNQQDYAQNQDPERDWGSTESIPVLTEACNQFQARTQKAFFPNAEFVAAVPTRYTKDPVQAELLKRRAQRIGRHMSWQLSTQNRKFKRDKNALFLGVACHGSFFTKTYFDAIRKMRTCVDNVRPTDLVVDYNCGPIDIEDVRRKTHVIYTTVGETQSLMNKMWFVDEAKGDSGSKNQYNVEVDTVQGLTGGYNKMRRDQSATLLEQHFYLDLGDTGEFLPYIGTIDLTSQRLLRLVIGYEADPMGKPLKDYEQTQYFTHYKFMENPDGFYGFGLGHMLGELNSAINIGVRQVLDAATLSTAGNASGFISERIALDEGDEFDLTLGKFRKVPAIVDDLNKSIMTMKFPGPNESQIKILEWLDQRAQRLGSTTEATTGSIDTNRQPTTVLAQIEQSLELFSSVQMGLAESMTDELQKIYRNNQKYLPLVEYFVVNDAPDSVTRADYAPDMLVKPIFDPKFSTRAQKVAKAQAELQATMQNPLSQTRPWVFDIAFRRYLEALDSENIDELVPPTPVEMLADAYQQLQLQAAGPEGSPVSGNSAAPKPGAASPMAGGQANGMGDGADLQAVPEMASIQGGGLVGTA